MVTFLVMFDPYNVWGLKRTRELEYTGDNYTVDMDKNIVIDRTTEGKLPTTIAAGKWLSIVEM